MEQYPLGKALIELMDRLGYDKFAAQGGDAGCHHWSRDGPLGARQVHWSCTSTRPLWAFFLWARLTKPTWRRLHLPKRNGWRFLQEFMQVKFGFNLLQSNQPQLVAYAISDSPVGLMSWMTQLMDPGEVGERFLTNFMVYWLTGTCRFQYSNVLRECS
jgi:hypothetical protein